MSKHGTHSDEHEQERAEALEAYTRYLAGEPLSHLERKVLQKWTGDPEFDELRALVLSARRHLAGVERNPAPSRLANMKARVMRRALRERRLPAWARSSRLAASALPAGTDSELVQSVYADAGDTQDELPVVPRPAGAVESPSRQARSDSLIVHLEAVEADGVAHELEIKLYEAVFGRGNVGLQLGGDPQISRHHARVLLLDGQVVLNDLDSRNGTYVNGSRIYEPTPIEIGAVVAMGHLVFTLEQVESEARGYARAVFSSDHGDRYLVDLSEIVLGRGQQATAPLHDATLRLSRRHARLDLCDGQVFLTDLGSTNGTLYQGARIDGSIVLEPEMVLQLGGVELRVVGMVRP